MKKNLFTLLSVLVLTSLALSACGSRRNTRARSSSCSDSGSSADPGSGGRQAHDVDEGRW